MNIKDKKNRMVSFKWILSAALIVMLSGFGFILQAKPQLPFKLALGQEKFQANCISCHATDLRGTDKGPPLLHPYYKSSHHNDAAFFNAMLKGSPQHHWDFGDMPPVSGITVEAAQQITEYIRWVQKQEGLE